VLDTFLAQHKKIAALKKDNQQEWQAKALQPFGVLKAFKKQLAKIFPEEK